MSLDRLKDRPSELPEPPIPGQAKRDEQRFDGLGSTKDEESINNLNGEREGRVLSYRRAYRAS